MPDARRKSAMTPPVLRRLPPLLKEQLALCASYPDQVLFLDIETTGLSHYYDEITVVGWAFNGKASTFVKGDDHHSLLADARHAKAMVTFNGIRFDQRFLRQEFPDVRLPETHIDLMYLCRRVGLTGGQKSIEKQIDLNLRTELSDVDGFAAVLLWHRYLRGEISALEKLVRYNRLDIAAMGAIFDHVLAQFEIQPDLFTQAVGFINWSAPDGWQDLPKFNPAGSYLTKAPHFDDVLGRGPAAKAKIVGIDLTGSEARGTGWCVLDGNHATTATLFSDEDILARTLEAKPDLVSIDSPLCLPFGRLSVEDSDPGRDLYGIMRQCERELKRRGVNVYPCLLPSMQKLTARGMKLANTLRQSGVAVIESYPGAAQDIMRIPRKGAGIEWLKLGLHGFGISGDYVENAVTHDELDAITSALVGTFHMAGLTEALGTENEPPLIIPKLDAVANPIVVGVSGPIAAGKTTFAEELQSLGFSYTRFSLVIDDMLRESGVELTRYNRQELGREINATGRQRWLAEKTIQRVSDGVAIVVDGLRFPEDHAYLVERFGANFHHIYIEAAEDVRKIRYHERMSDGNFEQAAKSEVEGRVGELRSLAHEIFVNDSDKLTLKNRASELARKLTEGKSCLFQSS
ncbi:ribonuclease H-like domain-containing protein [Rhizobium sp. BK538]|uniref:ribonuclease H-like domain-containing protein n=1 Tax=Rhizobium sp. BK538 TaxID=2586984 RepID=UPI00161365E8|nr:ribonuclease H-like domain-containing protein [Rhizobium sp. BK538]MBB4169310.1 putative nuclease with RNAse H fold/dephospho-CoA kinase [Rhizobium sp. BK538]